MGRSAKPRTKTEQQTAGAVESDDEKRLKRLLDEQARLLDAPLDDTMSQRQRLADVRARIYTVEARMATRVTDRVAYEKLATEATTEARQCAKAASVDALRKLLAQRDQELSTAAAFNALKARKRKD